eukprot:TRINITY_DN82273_c0_g1_i1.p1 TRINITY_DN82273_c0_g1~~TRINITY_DN82273_c0_g1_i1.p1  ORF type:complete len:463 (+),score=80.20 TRINITY_DN82273_c0_g1_i1:153-1391(+)
MWCNGECKWWRNKCVDRNHKERHEPESTMPFLKPPDTRPEGCKKVVEGNFSDLKVSIIIPWHKEKWLHLRHTLEALVHFTPDELVEEYFFISDGNADTKEAELKAISPKVRVLAYDQRQGLIRAKSAAVKDAKAPVLMFMEAHCIVNTYWLEPLLERLRLYPKAIVMPVLDHIDQNDWFSYHGTQATYHWRFEWNMNLINSNPTGNPRGRVEPYTSPGTSGGIFVMRKDWFVDLEFFDEGMLEWGGDHVELSFKTWRCGGRIEMVPCSRIGHLFRDPEHRPYPVNVDQVVLNYDRLARLWWTDHIEVFRRMKPETLHMKHRSTKEAEESYARVQAKFNCKDHQWYIDNVDHEMEWEMHRVCHPYLPEGHRDKCKGPLSPGRWTLARGDEIPVKEYKRRVKAVRGKSPASDEL